MKRVIPALLAGALLSAGLVLGQTTSQHKSLPPALHTLTDKKIAPTLGFARMKGVSPVLDQDALAEEEEMQKKLPGNEFVKDKRAFHEAALMNDFVEGFQDSKQCKDITLYVKSDKKPDFVVQIGVLNHDDRPDAETWTWMLFWPADPGPATKDGHGMGGMGSQTTGKLAARDVCLTIWDDLDPNHFKKPGGKIE